MTIIYFVLAALALGILVFLHELGHYIVAKKVGMTVEVFSIGFGRPLIKWRFQNVDWQLGWLPFGGYVKIKGMEFSKKDKQTYNEPHEIPDGFFSKSPMKRIAVAIAGPLANFIIAFLLFTAIWAMGGREKPFSEFTHIIGWVDPNSEIYANGVRPGDILSRYNGKPYSSSKDLLYAAMMEGKDVKLEGYHVNQATGEKIPFAYNVQTYPAPGTFNGILTTGIGSGASYLIYDRLSGSENPLPAGSPMNESGIAYGDRLVWADGEILFSLKQLNRLMNSQYTLLTVKRNNHTFLTRQPRVSVLGLVFPSYVRNELTDWQYESGLRGRWQDLYTLPYIINSEGYVEAPLNFIDEESRREAFPLYTDSPKLEKPLEAGDRILAVDGLPVAHGYDIFRLMQGHMIQLIAQRNVPVDRVVSWKNADIAFDKELDIEAIETLASGIGLENVTHQYDNYILLNPIEPKSLEHFDLSQEARDLYNANYQKQREEIEALRDKDKKRRALEYLEKAQNDLLLGISLQDRRVEYNPSPVTLFGNIFVETWQTLKALILGYLNPKWISGPVGIVQVIHHGWQVGIGEALFWIGAISLNLGVLNLLPIPVLDGGHICLALWEMITRKRVKAKTMERLIIPFVVLLIGLLVFLTFQDLSRLF